MFETLNNNLPTLSKKTKKGKGLFQSILNVLSWLFLGLFALTLVFTAVSNLKLLGGYQSLIVQSGSMEPTIMTGDVIVIAKANDYIKNDVVTFHDDQELITTHRIIDINNQDPTIFITKGDANRVQDDATITFEQVLGKVVLTIPKLGYFLVFVRSRIGLVIFVGFPALLITIDEVVNIRNAIKRKR